MEGALPRNGCHTVFPLSCQGITQAHVAYTYAYPEGIRPDQCACVCVCVWGGGGGGGGGGL